MARLTKNKDATKYYSSRHEESVAKALGGETTLASGASMWAEADVIVPRASLLVECKCPMKDEEQKSFGIKKEWLDGIELDRRTTMNRMGALSFNFGLGGDNYYVINENVMRFLVNLAAKEFSPA